jgi:outer membrane protein OmpA-like peptidoglycan-associated protein
VALLVALTLVTLGALRATNASAQFPFGESFQNATAPGFVIGGAASLTGGSIDPEGEGWLRLTPASNQRFGYAYNQTAFPSSEGISYEFDYAAWGGSGADGFAFVLFDGATTDAQFHAGVNGGALGYSPCNGQPGLSNAYMGLGFDMFGYFASRSICQNQTGIDSSMHPNTITVRGGVPDYRYLHSVQADDSVGTGNRQGARRVTVTVLPKNGQTTLTASVRAPDGTVQPIANDVVLPNPPPTLKFGFTASTGGLTNNHEIRGMNVAKPTDLQVEVEADEPFAARDAEQSYTATVTNAGPNPTTGVDIASVMPDTDDVAWTCTASGGASCAFASGTGTIDGDFGAMPVGGELEFKITGTLTDDADFSKLSLEAQPTGDTSDVNPVDNDDEASTPVTPAIDAGPTYVLAANGLATATSATARGGNLTSSWQWLRCTPAGANCVPIDGATSITYQTTAADRESNLRVQQLITNAAGADSAYSDAWTLPDTSITSTPTNPTRQLSTFAFTSATVGATFECRLDDTTSASWLPCGSPGSLPGLSDGEHRFDVRAVFGGLSDPTPATHEWTVDTTTSAAITAPAGGATSNAAPAVTMTGESGASWTLRVDGAVVDSGVFDTDGNASSTAVTGLADGSRVIRVDVEDAAGNVAYDTVTLLLDTVAPLPPSIGHGPPPATPETDAEVDFTVEPGTTSECRLDGGPWVPCTSPWKGDGLPDGNHVLEIRTTDDADNESDVTTHEWTVDTKDPEPIAWGDVPAPESSDPNPTFSFAPEPGSTTLCRVDGAEWKPCPSPLTLTDLRDGPHVLEVKVVDPAGNESKVVEHRWTVDTTPPPAPTVLSGPTGPTTDATATFGLAGEPGAALECSLDGGAWTPCPATLVLRGLGLGERVLRVRQTDAAGNVSKVGDHRWTVVPVAIAPPTPTEPVATTATTRVASKSTVSGSAGTVRVGCALDQGTLERCVVRIYERKSNGKRGALIGTGSVRVKNGRSTTVSVKLNARGKRVVARTLGGRAVIVSSTATERGGRTLRAKAVRTRLFPQRLLTVPTVLPFAIDRGVVTGAARRVVADVAPELRQAKSVRCIGFTDSRGSAAHNERLGQRRADAVCRTLRQMGVRAKLHSSSRGEEQPRASNETAAGRTKNRRVELVIRY